MKIRNTRDVSIHEVQCYLTNGAYVHPELYYAFLVELQKMEYAKKLSLLPQTRMQLYSRRVAKSIASKLAA